MGTTVSNLQIIGTTEDAVKAAMPKAVVGKWSERFITACPGDLYFGQLDRKAGWLSKKLECTVLSVSMFDGDDLSLALYVSGKRAVRHVVYTQAEGQVLGNTNVFCTGLGLPPQVAPLLKRLFTEPDQEEKLHIFSCLLGAPLFVRWDDDFTAVEFQPMDEGPLHTWIDAHPLPPKLKNQTKMEMMQEIGDRTLENDSSVLILRPLSYADEEYARLLRIPVGTFIGHGCSGGEWAHWSGDGRLLLTPLMEDGLDNLSYAEADGRLLTFSSEIVRDDFKGYTPGPVHVVSDSDGLLPLPLPLASTGTPMTISEGYILSNGSFLAVMRQVNGANRSALFCYSAKGDVLWNWKGRISCVTPMGDRIYLSASSADGMMLHCLTLEGQCLYSAASHSDQPVQTDGVYLYQLKQGHYQQDDTLLRFTLDLQGAGQLSVPYMSNMSIAPDSSFLVCAGYGSGLMVINLEEFKLQRELRNQEDYYIAVVDGKNRIWVANGGYFECWSPDLEPLSRHRFVGDIVDYTLNQAGEVCIATHQQSKHLTRVYRFCGKGF
ncbi:MAG: hypothetical protein BHV90_24280 [Clostridiales bacterium 42_27]|nr:MAG: hypothetical protein BHV90_24280 [Clostridiales bacterium 42_27]